MPDTLTPDELRAIRERGAKGNLGTITKRDRRALLAHIDALTAAVRPYTKHGAECGYASELLFEGECFCGLRAVLAILEPHDA